MPDTERSAGSVYAGYLDGYGRRWYRPWLVLLLAFAALGAVRWLARPPAPTRSQRDSAAGRYRVARIPPHGLAARGYKAAVDFPAQTGLPWTADLGAALRRARGEGRLVLVAFHGLLDTNSKINERDLFGQGPVRAALRPYVRVVLYADRIPARFFQVAHSEEQRKVYASANALIENWVFSTAQTPLYAIIHPVGEDRVEIVGEYEEGRIQDVERFTQFLRKPLERPGTVGAFLDSLTFSQAFVGIAFLVACLAAVVLAVRILTGGAARRRARRGLLGLLALVVALVLLWGSLSPRDLDGGVASPRSPPSLFQRLHSWLGW